MIQATSPQQHLNSEKLWGLDHLRAVAIIMVLVYHYGRLFPHPEWTEKISKFGWTGVDLFFVLSGYLIASQQFAKIAASEKISFPVFFIKRFFRIIPAFAVVVGLYFLFPFLREREGPAPLWKYLTFTQNLGLDLRTQGTFSHAWSLCIEEQFYLFFPLILMALIYLKAMKHGYWLLVLLFAAGFAVRLFSWYIFIVPAIDTGMFWVQWQQWIYYPTWCRLDGLLIGVSIAAFFQFKPVCKKALEKYGNHLLFASLVVLAAAYFLCLDERTFAASVFGFPLVDAGYGLLVAGAVLSSNILYRFRSFVTSRIASLSYALYLIHKISIHVTQELLFKLQIEKESNIMFLACVLITLITALVLNKLVEKPFLKLRDAVLKMSPKTQSSLA